MSRKRRHERAFTLTEMLVVIGIILTIFAIGTSFVAFSQGKYQLQATANGVISALRRARSEAMSTDAPVHFVLEKEQDREGQIQFYPEMPVASWEFDEKNDREDGNGLTVPGAFGQDLTCRDQVRFVPGFAGAAVEFRDGPSAASGQNTRAGTCVHPLDLRPRSASGFLIRFSYWTGEVTNPVAFVAKKNRFSVGLSEDARLIASVGELTVVSQKPSAPATWTEVRVTFHQGSNGKDRLTLYQNGRKVAETTGSARFAQPGSNGPASRLSDQGVHLGVYPAGFTPIRMDRLQYSRIIKEELGTIPKSIVLKGDRQITFHSDGTAGSARITLSREGFDRSIAINVLSTGAIERIGRTNSSDSTRSPAPSEAKTSSSF